MRHNLTSSKGERLKKIEFGDDAQHLPCFHDRKGIEIMLLKQRFQVTQGDLACHSLHGRRHILTRRAFEKAIRRSTWTIAHRNMPTGLLSSHIA